LTPRSIPVPAEAADTKHGMTVDEMTELLQRARDRGATGSEPIHVTTAGIGTVRIRTARVTVAGGQAN
jgi:hypothetical protein